MSSETLPLVTSIVDLPITGDLTVASGAVASSSETPSSTVLDPDIYYSIISNDNSNTEFTLAAATTNGTIKKIKSNKLVNIYVATAHATYLLNPASNTIDLIYSGKWLLLNGKTSIHSEYSSALSGTNNVGQTFQGSALAISADGNTLVVGSANDNSWNGAIWVFTRADNGTWSQQGEKITSSSSSGASMGWTVDVSADGNTIAAGGYDDNSSVGAVWVFVRSSGTWSQQGSKLIGTGNTGASRQGFSVALSADGNTLVTGGYSDDSNAGAAWVFVRTGTTWAQQGSKLVGTGATGAAIQGNSIALSADGNTLALGGPADNTNAGAVWIFVRTGTSWAQQGSKLTVTGASSGPYTGWAVSLSADGNTLATGGYTDGSGVGAAWILVRTGTTWAQQGSKLVGSGNSGNSNQGNSLALSADGNTLAVGGYKDNSSLGAVWMWARNETTWSQQGSKFAGTGVAAGNQFGINLAISAEGDTLAIGADKYNSNIGATWVYS